MTRKLMKENDYIYDFFTNRDKKVHSNYTFKNSYFYYSMPIEN